ncbi:MAG: putative manganese-dependent inorganic diphosphatase [Treponema sp.]|nr:putative manganese-dependent inorganic diphosphatase [Spirochaetia bacterium]MDD6295194.1 putative manganese-dependent inorganic diphosphatase [Treponema sp.]MDD7451461.1 putative manganese-dependent inorganic diphosphatase [Treponema sp.]MDY2924105.1 putative manganese-dependent inorganic diphosphatase [Treponema sp.]MDY3886840.1 putative manganese-dependent inorganic diphosphatase [Treponema sp.]
MKKTVYIIGHRNPDTDSAVAAASYARLKQLLGYENYVAARAGHFTPQTEYIFNKFKVPVPEYIPDLIPKTAYFMQDHCETVSAETSLWAAIGKMNTLNYKVLPVVDSDGTYKSLLHYNAFAKDVLTILNPEKKIGITTSVDLVCSTLNAQPIIKKNSEQLFKCMIMIGSAKIETVRANLEEHKSENLIVIASNREDVHEACINAKVKLLVITSGYVLNKELRAVAEKNNVSVLISPYDTSSTSMLVSYSTPVSVMADASVQPVMPGDTVAKVRPKLQTSASRCLPVVDSNNKVCGLINESDLLHEPNVEVILVDHNEMSQAVEGVENYRLLEVIDHHRVGNLATKYPITFINKPVGATSTLIASLFRENKISIPLEIASILLCAILTDTLILQSTTTTDIDREMAEYLSNITNLDIQSLGEEIISAGSRIGGRDASEVIRQDMKEYSEGKLVYTVSQIEVDNTNEILKRKKEFLQELEFERRSRKGLFSALLVTDIASLSSILLIEAEKDFLPFIAYPKREENVYYLKDIVSRKKQLIPMISEVVSQYAR